MLTVGSLFSGIGGLELGLERTGGFKTVWQVECDPYAQAVLKKHWPDVGRWDDVRTFPPAPAEDWRCDVICGGFPCQDISSAGKRAGIDGERSGLWAEYIRIIRVLRPRYMLVENVAALLDRGMGRVLGELAESGYDAEWQCLPACAFGAPHIRDRVFILAYPEGDLRGTRRDGRPEAFDGCRPPFANPERMGRTTWCGEQGHEEAAREWRDKFTDGGKDAADAYHRMLAQESRGTRREGEQRKAERARTESDNWWFAEPDVGRVANGVPNAVDRRRCLGNAVVPAVAQWIGERIMAADAIQE